MTIRSLLICLLLTMLLACKQQSNTSIDIAFRNQTTNELDFVEASFGENTCSSGVLIPNALSVTIGYRYQITQVARVRWKATNGVVKIKEVTVNGIVPPRTSGRMTFSIHEDRVVVTFNQP